MHRVVLDTNALLMPFEFNFNLDLGLRELLGECEVYVPGPVLGELKRSKNKHAKAALSLASKYKVYEMGTQGDAGVLQAAKELGAYVLTNDFPLQKKLRKEGIKVIYLRSKNHLTIDEI
ncbi:MAG: twitching motility protein PilT [Methanomassiliicoccales archaeon]|nr:MAG: twitching motility protein PilT [Methanomassiliicoccales archaeon]